jgi:hypothetical protein
MYDLSALNCLSDLNHFVVYPAKHRTSSRLILDRLSDRLRHDNLLSCLAQGT